MEIITTHQAKTHLSKFLKLAQQGEEFIIANGSHPVAKLVPYHAPQAKRVGGQWAGLVHYSADFDAPLPDDILDGFNGK